MNRWFHKVPSDLMKDVPAEYITWHEADLVCRGCHKTTKGAMYAEHVETRYCEHCRQFKPFDVAPSLGGLNIGVDTPDPEE
jgi:hypothetical protein